MATEPILIKPIESEIENPILKAEIEDLNKRRGTGVKELIKHLHNMRTVLLHSNATPIRNHSGIGYLCSFCSNYYDAPADLKTHTLETHLEAEINKYMDGACPSTYIVKVDITDLKCTLCDSEFDVLEQLFKHLSVEHGLKIHSDIKNRLIPFKFDDGTLRCCVCELTFEGFKGLREHMNTHYRNFVCRQCNLPFITDKMFRSHLNRHKKGAFECPHCCKTYDTKSKMTNHVNYAHKESNQRNKCPYCDAKFISYPRKRVHMKEAHDVEYLVYKCKACDKSFPSNASLNIHTKRVHLMQKDVECLICDRKFFSARNLKRHMLSHSAEKMFKCNICLKSYQSPNTLREHRRIHKNDRRFKCSECSMAFLQKATLKGHLEKKHPNAVYMYI